VAAGIRLVAAPRPMIRSTPSVVDFAHVSLITAMMTSHIMEVIRTIETAPAGARGGGLMLATSSADSTIMLVAVTILRTHVVVV
jgi:hypothetical protein